MDADLEVIDCDTHLTEAPDLWTSRAPARFRDRVPQVEEIDGDLQTLVDRVGDERILFETDFPHPSCLYPDPLGTVGPKLATLRPESRRRILGENAATLYRL